MNQKLIDAIGITKEEAIKHLEHVIADDEDIDFFTFEEKHSMNMAISALKGGWIPVESEEKPKVGQKVLATIVYYDGNKDVQETTYDKYGFMCGNATAWQPLPEPYKKGE